jgi:hypothetical protein
MLNESLQPAITMKDAKTVLLEFLAVHARPRRRRSEDGAVELPFLHSLGVPWRHSGRRAITIEPLQQHVHCAWRSRNSAIPPSIRPKQLDSSQLRAWPEPHSVPPAFPLMFPRPAAADRPSNWIPDSRVTNSVRERGP